MTTPGITLWRRVRGGTSRWLGPVVAAATLALVAWLVLAAEVHAATEAPQANGSGNATLLIAGLAGAAIAAVWLLKPSRQRRPPKGDEDSATDESQPPSA